MSTSDAVVQLQPRTLKNLWIENGSTPPIIRRASIIKSENEHEKASLFVQSDTRTLDYNFLTGMRTTFTYGTPGASMNFFGYVAEIVPNQSYQRGTYVTEQEFTILGPTMVMKGNQPRFFTDCTIAQAIGRIVSENGLGISDETNGDPTVWRSQAQTAETDWEMIVKLADRIGAHVLSQRGVVRLIDYNDVAYRMLPSHSFNQGEQTPIRTDDNAEKGSIVEFTPVSISANDPLYQSPAMAFLEGGKAVYVPSTGRAGPVSQRFATQMPARSAQEAAALQAGYYVPPWNQEAQLTAAGDATIEPASIISIVSSTKGSSVQTPNYDGLWYVKSVTHSIYANRFVSIMDLGRASQRGFNWYPERPFWLGDKRGIPDFIRAGDGRWLSTWRT